MTYLSTTSCRSDLDLQTAPREERVDCAQVIVELESIGDHRLGIDDAFREQSKGAFEAVKDRHRAYDLDLVVVDPKRRERGGRVGIRNAEHEERSATRHSSDPVLDGRHDSCRIDHDVPALRLV